MENDDPASDRVQQLVTAIAEAQGINPSLLIFKWRNESLVLQEHMLKLTEKVFNLRIHLEKKSQVLSFTESAVQNAVKSPETALPTPHRGERSPDGQVRPAYGASFKTAKGR